MKRLDEYLVNDINNVDDSIKITRDDVVITYTYESNHKDIMYGMCVHRKYFEDIRDYIMYDTKYKKYIDTIDYGWQMEKVEDILNKVSNNAFITIEFHGLEYCPQFRVLPDNDIYTIGKKIIDVNLYNKNRATCDEVKQFIQDSL